MEPLKQLIDSRNELLGKARAILDRAASDKRELNSEERAEYDKLEADIEGLCDKIDSRNWQQQKAAKLAAIGARAEIDAPRQTAPTQPGLTPSAGNDGASLTLDFGRAGKLNLAKYPKLKDRAGDRYSDAFLSYVRGDKRDFDALGLKVGDDSKGGYLAPMEWVATLIKFLDNDSFVRQLATVLPPTMAKSVGAVSYDADPGNADWTAEIPASDIAEDDTITYGKRELMPHLLTKLLKASRKMVASNPELATFLAARLAYVFGITEESAFLQGTGSQQPLGIFTASDQGITTSQDITASAATAFTADDLINTLYDLKDAYAQRATWIGTREFRKRCRKLKDGAGNYLLVESNNGGTLTTLLERPLRVSEYAPSTYTTGLYVAAVGDFSHYWIQDGMGLEIQNLLELFALRNNIGYLARKETDGMPVLAEAFRRLKLG